MKEMLINMLSTILIAFTGMFCFYICKAAHQKIEQLKQSTTNEALKALLDKVDYIIQVCVEATNQTFVSNLKKDDNFTKEDQETAFNMTFSSIENMLTDEDKRKIVGTFGDMSTFIRNSIEKYIQDSKDI